MKRWIVTPIKAPESCKTRLGTVLDAQARCDLVADMLRHVVDVAGSVAGDTQFFLLGPSRHGLAASLALLPDGGAGLNAELAHVTAEAVTAGVERLVIVPADLPLLTKRDLDALLGVPAHAVAVVPDRAGSGTNALSLSLPRAAAFQFQFGANSFVAHCREAGRLGLPLEVISSETLAFDVDEPEDLALLVEQIQADLDPEETICCAQ